MKKSLLALAALTAFAGAASAQSSVTLFGIIDEGARVVDNASGGKLKTLSSDGAISSRFGLRGIEDMGGGLKAGFWLEGALGADTGLQGVATGNGSSTTNGLNFQRRSTVSLMGDFGEIRLGRDYTPTFLNAVGYEPWNYQGVTTLGNARGKIAADSGVGTSVRANNMISYFLPSLGGIFGQISAAAGENAPGNKMVGVRLGYAAGPISIAAAYQKTYKTSGPTGATTTSSVANLTTGVVTSTTTPVISSMVGDFQDANVGASYDFGFMKIMGEYEKQTYSTADQKMVSGAVVVPFGASTIKLSAAQFKGTTLKGSSNVYAVTQFGLGYEYALSKRTNLYANYGRDANKGNSADGATFTASGMGNPGIKGGETSQGYSFGVYHTF